MQGYGLATYVLPVAPRPHLLRRLADIEGALALTPDAVLRLGALAVEIPEDADRLRDRLRLSNDEHAELVRAAMHPQPLAQARRNPPPGPASTPTSEAAYRQRVLIAWARSGDGPDNAAWRDRFTLPERWQPPRFPLGGADVMALGVPAGPRIGELLRALEAWWIAGDFAADEAALRVRLGELARS